MRRCVECGSTVMEGSRFCPACGAPVDEGDGAEEQSSAETDDGIDVAAIRDELARSLAPRYEVRELLGRGAMGLVFQARETELRRLVAVKVLSPVLAADETARRRFSREARAAAAVSNAFVVPVYGVGETGDPGLPYIVMQYVNGPTLASWMGEHPRPGEATARRLVGEIARALAAAHSRGLVHRDVKPGNVLLDAESGRALVADFGVAAVLPASPDAATQQLTTRGQIFGTYAYMSPEQISGGTPGPASDVYSLGILAHELFAGEPPLDAPTPMAWAAAHLRDRPASLAQRRPELSPECAEILDRCLAKEPERRPTAKDVADCLLAPMDAETAWPPPSLRPLRFAGRRARLLALATAAGGGIASLALAMLPDAARIEGEWWQRFADVQGVAGSTLGASVEAREAAAADPGLVVWSAALAGGAATFVVALLLGLVLSAWIAVRTSRALGQRAPRQSIMDVLADPDGRSGLLIHGEREFAALSADRRSAVLRHRRLTTLAMLASGAWVAGVLGAWSLAVFSGVIHLRGTGAPVGWPLLALLAVPALVGLSIAIYSGTTEARLLRPLPRRRRHASPAGEPAASQSARDPGSAHRALPLVIAPVAALALLGALAFSAVVSAAAMTSWLVIDRGPVTAAIDQAIDRTTVADPLGTAQRAWRFAFPESLRHAAPDDSVRRWLAMFSESGAPPYERAPLSMVERDAGEDRTLEGVAATLRRVTAAELSGEAATAIAPLAQHPRTQALRKLAGVRGADLSGAFAPPAGGSAPSPPVHAALREAAEANALLAALSSASGDRASAIRRLGENAALADRLLAAPTLFANQYGAGMLQDLALMPLADLEATAGDTDRAARLRAASAGVREHLYPGWSPRELAGLAADPADAHRLRELAADPRIAPGIRAATTDAMTFGYCFNVREVLSGPSDTRSGRVPMSRSSAGSLIDRMRECAALRR